MTITADDLRGRLTLDAHFIRWSWEDENKLEIVLLFDGEEIATASTYIEPSGYEREHRND